MHVTLDYTAETEVPFEEAFFNEVASRTLEECRFPFLHGKEVSLNVIAVTGERIRELNRTYRDKDAVTDVLSFGEYADREALARVAEQDIFLGDIFFCPAFIAQAAAEDEVTFQREMTYIFSHGVLHLVGFDHEEEMFEIQDRVTDAFSDQ
ncbi:MAG: rRNA maturation RNase YbeY [Candidatus Moranbacteria bacterium RIFCSPHIGHO2_12_FULL_54_9]|nr:MAG: rRNA maturation RNase YbeY [Candidatus Moranbacteria bacterium RIFCSPHIGHO2_01_FULL_54_31]OGI24590.1 MAG: rRNA maturation RNase YbeY [Candidatus Moranbacteria bacterium RIFCSPHIGHO2_12_FULL_54_9]